MGYLLSQILISLLLASVVGGAVGWILHGYKAHQREQRLKESLDRQSMALQQAHSERQMIADDFDELKMHLEGRIADLQGETREIPKLEENLEKSQTLVRQMMQKHDSEIIELDGSREKLIQEVDTLRLREKNYEAEITALKKVRDEHISTTTGSASTRPASSTTPASDSPAATVTTSAPTASTSTSATASRLAGSAVAGAAISGGIAATVSRNVESQDAESQDWGTTEFDSTGSSMDDDNAYFASDASDESLQLSAEDDLDELTEFDADTYSDLQPIDKTITTRKHDLEDDGLDTGYKQAFVGDSDNVDDLKSIHGIGPVIEQSLNDIGITSYQQIAELSRKQIQEIADILEIFPGRIERDNWIGSAKKLVKEELEEA